jgi:glutathione-regulated potassium-efflux system ancillary protein KefC/glutathione-regulated potassium-efflux system protein KefB
MNGHSLTVEALVYLAAGVVSVPIAKRLGLGSVLGYLIAGAVIGPFALGLVGQQVDVMRFAEFGVVILLFLIGLEVRPALLWSMRGAIFGVGGAQVAVTAVVLAAGGAVLGLDWRTALATGLVLAMSSTAIVLQTLDEKGLRQSAVGQTAFGVLLMQDLAVIPLFALLPLLAIGHVDAGAAAAAGGAQHSLLAGAPGWLRAIAVLAAVTAVTVGGRYLTRPLFRFIAAARLREIFTASALLLVIGVAVLMEMVGLSPALGAFLAGVVLAESEFRRELETDIEPFRGLLLGLFFITVGAGLNLGLVMRQPLQLLAAVLAVMVIKAAVMFALALAGRLNRRDAAVTGVALSQVGEFAFVLLTFTAGVGVLGRSLADFLAAVVALSMAATPVAVAGWERLAALRDPNRGRASPEVIPFETGAPDAIIAGFGRFGQVAGRLLVANGYKTVTLDSSIEHIDLLRRFGRRVHYGDASRMDMLKTAGADQAKLLVVAIDDRDKAVEMTENAREDFPHLKILARAWDRRHAYELLRAGADVAERETFESALALGIKGLRALGVNADRAQRAGAVFRKHDLKAFEALAPMAGDEERYAMANRDSRQTMERLLKADLDALDNEERGRAVASIDQADAAAAQSLAALPDERQQGEQAS